MYLYVLAFFVVFHFHWTCVHGARAREMLQLQWLSSSGLLGTNAAGCWHGCWRRALEVNTGEIDEIDVELVVVVWVRPGLRARSSLQPHAPFAATTSSLLLVIA
jgi:hypothetical protein